MATQGGGKSENQAKIELLYVSEGYRKSVQELQSLLDLVDKLKGDLGKVTMPAIKGLKGALRDAGELSQAIQALTHQGSVASVKPLSDKPTKKEQADYKKAMQVQAADIVVRQTQLDTQDKTLRLQRQLAAETAKELERQAFLGKLTQDQIKAQAGNIDNLKAIARGLEQSAKAGKAHAPLQQQVTTLLTEEISRRKLKATTERQLETQARQEERKVALEYARKAARSGDTGALKDYLKNAELQQVKNLEYAMRAEVGRKGYTKTSSVMDFNALVAERRKELTKTSPIVESSSILESIKAAKHKGDANYILSQAQAELRRQVKEGASPESLRQLYRTLADAKSEAAKKFAPISPYQEAKTAEEAHAKNLLSARFNKKTIAEASTAQIEAQLKASKILGHKTLAPFGSPKYQKEMGYQKFLTDTIKARALETPEAKEAKQRKEVSSENFKIRQQELEEAKKILPLTAAEVSRLSSQSEVEKHLHAIKVRGLKLGQDGYQDEVKYRQQLKNRLTELQKELSEDKKRQSDPAAYDLAEHRKSLRTQIQTQLEVNSTRSAERLKAKIAAETLKEQDLKTGKYSTVAALSNLPVSELKTARDTINYGVKQGLMSVTEAKELISKTKELEKAEVQRLKKLNEEAAKTERLEKIRSENTISRIKKEMRATDDLRQLKVLQSQLSTRIQAEFKADPKAKVLPFAEGLKAEIAEKIKNLSVPKQVLDLRTQAQDLRINNADTIAKNRQTAAEKAAQRAKYDDEKRNAAKTTR